MRVASSHRGPEPASEDRRHGTLPPPPKQGFKPAPPAERTCASFTTLPLAGEVAESLPVGYQET
jgi:hypothetical protein